MRFFQKPVSVVPALLAGTVAATAAFGAAADKPLLGLRVTTGVAYTDNRDSIPDGYVRAGVPMDKEDQWSFYVGPTITIHREISERLKLNGGYSPVWRWYDNCRPGSEKSKLNHSARVNLDYKVTPRTLLSVRETYWWTGQSDYFYGDDYDYDKSRDSRLDHDYYENRLNVAVKQDLTPEGDYAKVTGRWRIKRYEDSVLADSSDEDEYGLRLDLMKVLSEYVGVGVFADYTSWDREADSAKRAGLVFDPGVQYVTVGLQGYYDFDGGKDNMVYAAVGYNHAWYEADELDSQDLIGQARVELRLFQKQQTQALAGIRFGRDYSDIYPFSSQLDFATYLAVTHYFDEERRYRVNGSVEYRNRQYDAYDDLDPSAARYGYLEALKAANNGKTEYDRDSVYARLSATCRLMDNLSGSVFYSYEKIDPDIGNSYTENVVGANVTLTLF